MVRSIEIPEPILEVDSASSHDPIGNTDTFTFKVLVGGRYTVFERVWTFAAFSQDEDSLKDDFFAEFAERFKALMSGEDRT